DEVWASPVSVNLFHLLGINAVLGRTFLSDETQAVVLSGEYWRSHFSSDPKVIGKTLVLDGKAYAVVGVAPPDFAFPKPNTQMWIPLTFSAADKNDHEHRSLSVIGRLKAGVNLKRGQAEIDTVASRLATQYPKTDAGWSASIEPFRGQEVGGVLRAAVLALLGAVVFVLMIVCANVASMLLARGASRQGEMAIRAALGAGRSRLIRQLLAESVVLAGAGLMIQSFERLETAPTGFNPDHVLTVRVPLAKYKYSQGTQSGNFYREVLQRVKAIPGVKSAAMANNLPFTGFHTSAALPLP